MYPKTHNLFSKIHKIFPKKCTKRVLHYTNSFRTNKKCYVKYAKYFPK